MYRKGRKPAQVGRLGLGRGCALFLQRVYLTAKMVGPVHLAVAHLQNGVVWYVVSSEPTDEPTFDEYGLRVDIEENFLDVTPRNRGAMPRFLGVKSNGFQLESSMIRCAAALCRLCFVLAVATLFLVSPIYRGGFGRQTAFCLSTLAPWVKLPSHWLAVD